MRADCPSSTARLIARSILLSARHPEYRQLVPAGDAGCLTRILHESGPAPWFEFALRHAWATRCLCSIERAVLPGIFLHFLARKRWLERAVTNALRNGSEQVVVLGGGFDTLAWRLHREWPAAFFCELDHPATQRPKATALTALGSGRNFTLQPADLRNELPSITLQRNPHFDAYRRTCFVAEGLFMYFPAERVRGLLRDLASLRITTLAFTFMQPGADGHAAFRGGFRLIDTWLRFAGEPFAWAIHRDYLPEFLRDVGWRIESLADAGELRATILGPAGLIRAPLAEGEILCTATVLS